MFTVYRNILKLTSHINVVKCKGFNHRDLEHKHKWVCVNGSSNTFPNSCFFSDGVPGQPCAKKKTFGGRGKGFKQSSLDNAIPFFEIPAVKGPKRLLFPCPLLSLQLCYYLPLSRRKLKTTTNIHASQSACLGYEAIIHRSSEGFNRDAFSTFF